MKNLDIIELENERLAWSLKTFPEATALSSLIKAKTEIKEIEDDIVAGVREPSEYADALMCIFDSAGRQGITATEVIAAFAEKLQINKDRTWVKNPDNTYSHIKNKYVLKEAEGFWYVMDTTTNNLITKAVPSKEIAQEICDDFNAMEAKSNARKKSKTA